MKCVFMVSLKIPLCHKCCIGTHTPPFIPPKGATVTGFLNYEGLEEIKIAKFPHT